MARFAPCLSTPITKPCSQECRGAIHGFFRVGGKREGGGGDTAANDTGVPTLQAADSSDRAKGVRPVGRSIPPDNENGNSPLFSRRFEGDTPERDDARDMAVLLRAAGSNAWLLTGYCDAADARGGGGMVARDGIEPPTRGFSVPCECCQALLLDSSISEQSVYKILIFNRVNGHNAIVPLVASGAINGDQV